MNNLCDDQFITGANYTNTYSLWGNSKYYDIKNLSPQNYCAKNDVEKQEVVTEKPKVSKPKAPPKVKTPDPPDFRNRRIINRDCLYEDPESYDKADNVESPNKSSIEEWTQRQGWHKASEKQDMLQCKDPAPGSSRPRRQVVTNKIQKKLDKMLAKPVKMTIAENMMQKMGWQGGALGKSGDGITEPIAPNAVYASSKIGFGQTLQVVRPPRATNVPKKVENHVRKAENKLIFEMNVLHHIMDFIKNNTEVELLFDRKLRKDERKRIHQLVQFKINKEARKSAKFDSPAQLEMIVQIGEKNCYVLNTQSEGKEPWRQICIYKEAPPHVFLIIPDDLREEEEEQEQEEDNTIKEPIEELPEVKEEPEMKEEVEEETNPFLLSITRNLKKAKTESECPEIEEDPKFPEVPEIPVPEVPHLPEMSEIMTKIVEYFDEFVADVKYTEFKFLGPFSDEELVAINEFMELAMRYLNKEECILAQTFDKLAFDINEDVTGNTVIYKKPV